MRVGSSWTADLDGAGGGGVVKAWPFLTASIAKGDRMSNFLRPYLDTVWNNSEIAL